MTTRKRRLQITIEPEFDPIITRLSVILEKPQATIITDLLMDSLPVLEETVNALELAAQGKLDLHGLRSAVAVAIEDYQKLDKDFPYKLKHKDNQ